MSKEDLLQIDGIYNVHLENGVKVNARLCGKMKKFKIRIVVGDRVTVGMSPYDATHGLILFRHKA
jgi:translation initiation factor IF-1